MMPYKVYVKKKKEKNNFVYSLSVQYDNGGKEYIRKDALLEWADNCKKLEAFGVSKDFINAMEVLAQHLNSM